MTNVLQHIANYTGGEFYIAKTAEDIVDIYSNMMLLLGADMSTDTDGDGLPDIFETAGMRLPTGEIIYTDPLNADTDGDGLKDGEEIIPQFKFVDSSSIGLLGFSCGIYFKMLSDPTMSDSDGDQFTDASDPKPLNQYNNGEKIDSFDTKTNMVEMLQRCLEYLGYLEMPYENGVKSPYGTYGGATNSAIQLFQLNYGFNPVKSSDDMDRLTFATLINVAVNHGFVNTDIPIIASTKKVQYESYCKAVGFVTDKKYFSEINNIPLPINKKESESGVTTKKSLSIYYYDYTTPIYNLLEQNSIECIYMSGMPDMFKFIWFKEKVDHEKEWDIKREKPWNDQFDKYGIKYMSSCFKFYFDDLIITPENLGNITYGYWGTATNINLMYLLLGGDFAAITSNIKDIQNLECVNIKS